MEGPGHPGRAAEALAIAGRAAAASCGVLGVALGAWVLWRSAALLALLFVAVSVAVVLDRPVAALVRAGLGRAWAVALVLTGVGAVAIAAVALALGPLVAQVRELAAAAPGVADRLRASLHGSLGGLLHGAPVASWLREESSHVAGALAGGVYGAAGGVASAAGGLVAVLVATVLLLATGPDLVERAIGALPPPRRSWARALAHDLSTSLGGYLAGLSLIVLARLIATGTFLAVARVPFALPLSLLAGASVLIPYLGAPLRLLAIGAVAWATRGSGGAAASLLFVAGYDVLENYVLSPIVYRRTVGVSALAQLAAVLFLGYHFGVVGAVFAIPLVASAHVVVRTLRSPAPDAAGRAESRGAGVAATRPASRPPGDAPAGVRSGD
jgi:predicted PurR-regulated permease PerM